MSAPPPPLPVGWTEHIAPTGHPYWFNAQTGQSTYVRPLPSYVNPAQSQVAKSAIKEKPVDKTPIPGTPWTRVRTNQGNTFYTHKAEKRSVWTVPDEIKDVVAALEQEEREHASLNEADRVIAEAEKAVARQQEVNRIKEELKNGAKRKAVEAVPVDEILVTKKAKVEGEGEDAIVGQEDEESDSEESEEEEWQREAAAQLAAEAEEERRIREEEEKRARESRDAEKAAEAKTIVMPEHVEMSIEEGKALFKTLLREKDINPLHPWDTALPLFISDPRYVLLPSVSARREAFDEYCRDRARELRQNQVKKEKEDPKEEFDKLLREEVTSTRTSWTDFRRKWKKDRRFYGWGRDEREREKRFRDFVKELGEKKRLAVQKAEADFFALLHEKDVEKSGTLWKDVKHKVSSDTRYNAVGSSSLREELFNTYRKARDTEKGQRGSGGMDVDLPAVSKAPQEDTVSEEQRRRERQERAVREREDRIRTERSRVKADIDKSKMGLTREEGELQFRTLLTDAIRDPQASWETSLGELRTDPRFTESPLPMNQQLHIFHDHVNNLRSKQMQVLHGLFEVHAPSLAGRFSDLPLPSLLSSPPAVKLGLDARGLEDVFERWQRERNNDARRAFDDMLRENAFVEFWGRLRHLGGQGADDVVARDDEGMGEDEGEGGGGKVDMKKLASKVDLTDVVKVLKNDKRYIVFDHAPERRESWLRDYLSGLSAPKLSVHVGDS